ncbi:hypothetical protein CEUSTIGMA_g3977.t1 [Chlamydomonas eustigma]|uniref:Uncharacterized protein n=1 Tax=Chlamydomonas eustigma TaxID=1157962 RepID=A0A250X0D1_9CHLO|nr:hypothetical protein CEUSTIGMA_g3977.t1 [Chlamydomonas eustigma]|eukprot:GAX76531.1 hypothetical protein CEUSTIGMA_g3977.t1 [Chlamydomonas eustigma]
MSTRRKQVNRHKVTTQIVSDSSDSFDEDIPEPSNKQHQPLPFSQSTTGFVQYSGADFHNWQAIVFKDGKSWGRLVTPSIQSTSLFEGNNAVLEVQAAYNSWQAVKDKKLLASVSDICIPVDATFEASLLTFKIFSSGHPLPVLFTFSGTDCGAAINQHRQRIDYIKQQHTRFIAVTGESVSSLHPTLHNCERYEFERGDSLARCKLAFSVSDTSATLVRVAFTLAVVQQSALDEASIEARSNNRIFASSSSCSQYKEIETKASAEITSSIAEFEQGTGQTKKKKKMKKTVPAQSTHAQIAQGSEKSELEYMDRTSSGVADTHDASEISRGHVTEQLSAGLSMQPSIEDNKMANEVESHASTHLSERSSIEIYKDELSVLLLNPLKTSSQLCQEPDHAGHVHPEIGHRLNGKVVHQMSGPQNGKLRNGHINGLTTRQNDRSNQSQEDVAPASIRQNDRSNQSQEDVAPASIRQNDRSNQSQEDVAPASIQHIDAEEHPHDLHQQFDLPMLPSSSAPATEEAVSQEELKISDHASAVSSNTEVVISGKGTGWIHSPVAAPAGTYSPQPSRGGVSWRQDATDMRKSASSSYLSQPGPEFRRDHRKSSHGAGGSASQDSSGRRISADGRGAASPSKGTSSSSSSGASGSSSGNFGVRGFSNQAYGHQRSSSAMSNSSWGHQGYTSGSRAFSSGRSRGLGGSGAGSGGMLGPRNPRGLGSGASGYSSHPRSDRYPSRASSPEIPLGQAGVGESKVEAAPPSHIDSLSSVVTQPSRTTSTSHSSNLGAGPARTTDLERFLQQVTPMLSLDSSKPMQQALEDLCMDAVWRFYAESSLFGREVYAVGGQRGPSLCYFVPYLSAMQLFTPASPKDRPGSSSMYVCETEGWPKHMHLRFEHFEHEMPFNRTPLCEQLDHLAQQQQEADEKLWEQLQAARTVANEAKSDVEASSLDTSASLTSDQAASDCSMPSHMDSTAEVQDEGQHAESTSCISDPSMIPVSTAPKKPTGSFLKDARISELHPASWFAVAWYPVYRIPDAPLCARFLTFHSFSPLVISMQRALSALKQGQHRPVAIMPLQVVGLKWYNMHGERWLEALSDDDRSTVSPRQQQQQQQDPAWQAHLKELQGTAERIARGHGLRVLGPMGATEVKQWHPDFEFFNNRS